MLSAEGSNALSQHHALLSEISSTPSDGVTTKLAVAQSISMCRSFLCKGKQLHLMISAREATFKVHSRSWQLQGASHELTIPIEIVNPHGHTRLHLHIITLPDAWG